MNDTEYSVLKRRIRERLDIDIDAYKSAQMRRRLEAFAARHGDGTGTALCRIMDADAGVLAKLRDMLTINVSEFFRDKAQFDYLERTVLPDLLRLGPRLAIWSAGCSHGEEPYSVAIILSEQSAASRARILATDFDRQVLARARAGGPYRAEEVRALPAAILEKYFVRSGEGYSVLRAIRSRVEFAEHNLLADPFESGLDLIICRNVMIYFSNETKRQLFQKFRESLKPRGVLFIGGTEALLGSDAEGFEKLQGNFYRRTEPALARRHYHLATAGKPD
jgi:chemotaxis protein methyltransferase CheR